MSTVDMVSGRIYRLRRGDFAEFSRVGMTGMAIFHPPGKSDMQSSFAVHPLEVEREATPEEATACRGEKSGHYLAPKGEK